MIGFCAHILPDEKMEGAMPWRVIVDPRQTGWDGNWVLGLDASDGSWVEAWDEIYPGYKAQRFQTEREADGLARRLRSRGFTVATEEA
jgi:hypothetical protein